MMSRTLWLLTAVAGLAVSAGLFWWLAGSVEGLSPASLFLDADIIIKVTLLLNMLLLFAVAGLGLAAVIAGRGQLNLPLAIVAAVAIALGLLGALYGVMNVQRAIAAIGPVSFEVTAPSYAEAALAAAFGFFNGALALGLRKLGDRRPRAAS